MTMTHPDTPGPRTAILLGGPKDGLGIKIAPHMPTILVPHIEPAAYTYDPTLPEPTDPFRPCRYDRIQPAGLPADTKVVLYRYSGRAW